jgi:hypothetical protein
MDTTPPFLYSKTSNISEICDFPTYNPVARVGEEFVVEICDTKQLKIQTIQRFWSENVGDHWFDTEKYTLTMCNMRNANPFIL